MTCAASRVRVFALATLLLAAACGRTPELADLPIAPLPVDAEPAVTILSATVDATSRLLTVEYRLSDRGTPITGADAAALGASWTLAWLHVEPVSGLPAWRSLTFDPSSQAIGCLPPGGPGTPGSCGPSVPADGTMTATGEFLANLRQPGAESSSAPVDLGGGRFTYTFSGQLPLPAATPGGVDLLGQTLRVGLFLEGVTGTALTSATLDFVPNGAPVGDGDSVTDAKCNGCHGLLSGHGGKRTGVRLCVTCHTWLNADPDTVDAAALNLALGGTDLVTDTSDTAKLAARSVATKATYPNPLELGRLVHRIHRGKNLPTLYKASSCYATPQYDPTYTKVPQVASTALCNVPELPPTFPPNAAPLPPPAAPNDQVWKVPALPFRPARNAIGPAGIKASVIGEGGVELLIGRIGSRITNNQAARTFAMGIGYPQDLRNCEACHDGQPPEVISRRTCSGCHPDVWYGVVTQPTTAAAAEIDAFHMPHSGGPQADDSGCRDCHISKTSANSRWAPIADFHMPPLLSPRWKEPRFEIVDVQDLRPGSPVAPGPTTATIRFRVSDRLGTLTPLDGPTPAWDSDPDWPSPVPRKITSLGFRIAGPNSDTVTGGGVETIGGTPAAPTFSRAFSYTATCTTPVLTLAADADGVFTCTFVNPLANLNRDPARVEAQGNWTVMMEGRRASTATQYAVPAPYTGTTNGTRPADWPWYGWNLGYDYLTDTFRWPGTGETVTEAAHNVVVPVDLGTGRIATAPGAARRSIVAMERCNVCHLQITVHGARNDTRLCVACHAPDATDRFYRPRDLRMSPVGTGAVLLWSPLAFPAKPASAWDYYTYDGVEERSISIKTMVHRIHTGEREGAASLEGIEPYVIHTSASNGAYFDEARFPNRLANCEVCHLPGTWRIESVPADASPTYANEAPSLLHLPPLDDYGNRITPAATSTDGTTWASRSLPVGNYGAVAWGGGTFVAVGPGVAATSPDGVTWTARAIPAGSYNGVASDGTTFVAVGAPIAPDTTLVVTSPDGVTWTRQTSPAKTYVGIAWSGTGFAAVGTSAAATSPDGITWTAATTAPAGTFVAVAWGGGTFAAVGTSVAATSADGATWTARTIPAGTYTSIAWNGATFVAVGNGVAATSPDGITWTARTIPVGSFRGVTWTGSAFVAVGAGIAVTSPDGITWTWRTFPAGAHQAIAWSGSVLAAVGYTLPAVASHGAFDATGAVTSACLTCHTNGAAREHAASKTTVMGFEQCGSCHGENGAESVRRHHAVP